VARLRQQDRTVKVVRTDTGKSVFTFSGMDQDVLAVAVSPDGKAVVSSGFESSLFWWDPHEGKRTRRQGGHGVATYEVCYSKDGKLLASAGADRTAKVWDAEAGTQKTSVSVGSVTYAVALSPDAKLLATGSFDGLVRLWEVPGGRQLVTLLTLPAAGDRFDWLALTAEGYSTGSPTLGSLGQWQIDGTAVAAEAVGKVLAKPELVTKACRGEAVPAPTWK
jgi:WD40 repeat protein